MNGGQLSKPNWSWIPDADTVILSNAGLTAATEMDWLISTSVNLGYKHWTTAMDSLVGNGWGRPTLICNEGLLDRMVIFRWGFYYLLVLTAALVGNTGWDNIDYPSIKIYRSLCLSYNCFVSNLFELWRSLTKSTDNCIICVYCLCATVSGYLLWQGIWII